MSQTLPTLLRAVAKHYGHMSVSAVVSPTNPVERMTFMLLAKACGFTFEQTAEVMCLMPKYIEIECAKLLKDPARRVRYEKIIQLIRANLGKLTPEESSSASLSGGMDAIANIIADSYGISTQDLIHRSPNAPLPEARGIVMHLVRELLPDLTYSDLAMYFTNHAEDGLAVTLSIFRKKMEQSNLLHDKVEKLKALCLEKIQVNA